MARARSPLAVAVKVHPCRFEPVYSLMIVSL
jgi:hypothetical protein